MAKLPRRKCKVCREWFSPAYSNVVWCCPEHGVITGIFVPVNQGGLFF
ncbi:hypothetical protein HX37_20245 [Salmonella enterica]|uniref:Recombination protein NinG n=1 Tax=Salmonella enterica TaxID=28901 RepID=A0A5U2F867_SALER|nr:hypothetical protein [Salmonella enterica]